MMIIFGRTWYGAIDGIEGLGPVRTMFFHVFWVPLVPMLSVVGGYQLRALHWRSVLMTYVRTLSLWCMIGCLYTLYDSSGSASSPGAQWSWGLGALAFGTLLIFSYVPMRTASLTRALAILDSSAVPARHQMVIRAGFGMVSRQEVEAFIAAEAQAEARARLPGTNHPW